MIFFTEQLIKDKQELINSIQKELNLNNIFIHYQKYKESLLENTINLISSPSYVVNPEDKENLVSILESYKNSLKLSKNNIHSIEDLSALFESIKQMNDEELLNKLEDLNTKVFETNDFLLKNNTEILHTLELDLPKNISREIFETSNINISEKNELTSVLQKNPHEDESTENIESDSKIKTKKDPTTI